MHIVFRKFRNEGERQNFAKKGEHRTMYRYLNTHKKCDDVKYPNIATSTVEYRD